MVIAPVVPSPDQHASATHGSPPVVPQLRDPAHNASRSKSLNSSSSRKRVSSTACRFASQCFSLCALIYGSSAPYSGARTPVLKHQPYKSPMSRQMLAELNQHVNSIHNEGETGSTRALILASEVDSSFCAGADLKERATFTQEEYYTHSLCITRALTEPAARQTFSQPFAAP
jgi:hypothetical protein